MNSIAVLMLILGVATVTPSTGTAASEEGLCAPTVQDADAPMIPFKPGDVIDATRTDVLRDYLPREFWENRDRFFFEGMQLEIGPCFRDYSPPAFFSDATDKFRGQARLTDDGGLEGHVAGLPFAPDSIDPQDPHAGTKWAWNAQARYRAAGFRGKFRTSDLIGRIGIVEPFEGEIAQNLLSQRADRPADGYRVPNTGTRHWVSTGRLFTPFDARETAWHQSRDEDAQAEINRTDDLHVYLPNLRKVRRAPAAGIEGVFVPSFGVGVQSVAVAGVLGADAPALGELGIGALPDRIEPKRSGFEGLELRPQRYDYRLVRTQDVLAPINATRPAYPEDALRSFGPYGLSWASDRWELRRSIVLEGTRRQDVEGGKDRDHEAERVRTWFDAQTLYPLYYVAYDAAGEETDVGYFVGRWSEDRPDYPLWPDAPDRPVRVIDPVGEGFANLRLEGSWRRESWDAVSIPESDREVIRSVSIRSIQRGR